MTADTPGATLDYSRGPAAASAPRRPDRSAVVLRASLALSALTGVVLLVISTWITVVEIRVLGASELAGQDTRLSGGDLHGIALLPVAAFALVMLVGALRGARPAMVALAASGLLALGLVVGLDVPELGNTGQLADFYEDVSAGTSSGFYAETLGGVLLLLAGGGLLLGEPVSRRRGPA